MIRELSKSKSRKIPPRVPEGEAIIDMPELSMEELNEEFKKRMREYRNFVKFILYKLNVKDNSKVLEIGPGPAWITIIMAQENSTLKITGLEISEDMIRVANKNIEAEGVKDQIEFIQGSAEDMHQFDVNSFDVIITHDSLHHWDEPEKIFNEIARVLKPNGIFCIGDGRRDIGLGARLIYNVMKLRLPKEISYYWKTSINAGYTPEEISEILDKTDLKNKYKVIPDLFEILIINKLQ